MRIVVEDEMRNEYHISSALLPAISTLDSCYLLLHLNKWFLLLFCFHGRIRQLAFATCSTIAIEHKKKRLYLSLFLSHTLPLFLTYCWQINWLARCGRSVLNFILTCRKTTSCSINNIIFVGWRNAKLLPNFTPPSSVNTFPFPVLNFSLQSQLEVELESLVESLSRFWHDFSTWPTLVFGLSDLGKTFRGGRKTFVLFSCFSSSYSSSLLLAVHNRCSSRRAALEVAREGTVCQLYLMANEFAQILH